MRLIRLGGLILNFVGLTFEEFAGTPEIVHYDLAVRIRPPIDDHPREPFGDYVVAVSDNRADLYDGELRIAGFILVDKAGDSRVWVRPEYRGRRLSEELIYFLMVRTGKTVRSSKRSPHSQRLYRRVYDRIMHELRQILGDRSC